MADLRTFYQTTGRWKNLDDVEHRLAHVDGFFKGYRAAAITPDVLGKYIAKRQTETTHLVERIVEENGRLTKERRRTSNRTINLELALLRRAFRLGLPHP